MLLRVLLIFSSLDKIVIDRFKGKTFLFSNKHHPAELERINNLKGFLNKVYKLEYLVFNKNSSI